MMKSTISVLCALFMVQFSIIAQQNKPPVDEKKFLVQTAVDQIVYYNTYGENSRLDQSIYSEFLHNEDHEASLTKLLPQYYENKRVLTDTAIIREIIQHMPNDTCATVPVGRCGMPTYRDIILFYNKNELVFILKICFECAHIVSMPYKPESKCLANDLGNVFVNILGYDMFGKKRW